MANGKRDSLKVHRQSNLLQTGTKRLSVCVCVCVRERERVCLCVCLSGLRVCETPRGLSDGLDGETKRAREERKRGEEEKRGVLWPRKIDFTQLVPQ